MACADSIKSCKVISDALGTSLEITKLVKKSPQRVTKLEKIKNTHVDDGENPSPNIRMLCPTRRTVKADSMDSILKNYDCFMELWEWSIEKVKNTDESSYQRSSSTHAHV